MEKNEIERNEKNLLYKKEKQVFNKISKNSKKYFDEFAIKKFHTSRFKIQDVI